MVKKRSGFYFPEEIIFQILSWLPVLSILRFRSVCKSWRSMISNPKFIENHLANSHKKEAYVLRFASVQVDEAGRIGKFDNAFYVDTRDVSVTLHRPPQFSEMKHFVHSCNGLVCLSNRRGDVMCLWNPLTKWFKKLPTPNIQECFQTNLGFFFDSISSDYKLLRILVGASVLEVELYSTNANSWKEIQVPKSAQSFVTRRDSKFVYTRTGVLYLESIIRLLSFDSHNEVFRVYPFPNYANQIVMSDVLDFDGSVAMIFKSILDISVLSLWTLDDVCGDVAWVKKFRFEADYWISRITLYLGAGQFVAECIYDGRYCFYDYKKKKTKQLPLPPHPRDVMSAIKYNESLVSLEGFEQLD